MKDSGGERTEGTKIGNDADYEAELPGLYTTASEISILMTAIQDAAN